jgi:acetyl esterase/lipase
MRSKCFVLSLLVLICATSSYALIFWNSIPQESSAPSFNVQENIDYKTGANLDGYEKERCKLDLYIPENIRNFPAIVWFHGGSLTMGSKDDPGTKEAAKRFAEEGIAVAVVNYRLYPQVKYPAYINDAAAAVAWVMGNISKFGGDSRSVFVCGHSAGGYLSYMLALEPKYLRDYDVERMSIAGIVPIAGQTFTHSTIREERGIPDPANTPVIDEAAPSYHARKDTPPILIACADGDAPVTIAQNKYILALLNSIENKNVFYIEIKNHDHMTLVTKIPEKNDPLAEAIIKFVDLHKIKQEKPD